LHFYLDTKQFLSEQTGYILAQTGVYVIIEGNIIIYFGIVMKIWKIFGIILNVILFILALVLVLDNIQPANFNFFGIYQFHLPLIVMLAIFLAIGILIGFLMCLLRRFELKSQLNSLKKEVEQLKKTSSVPEHI